MWESTSEVVRLVECLAGMLHLAPLPPDQRARWVRGFVHGYLGMPFEVVEGITYQKDFVPLVLSSGSYGHAYLLGQEQRISRN